MFRDWDDDLAQPKADFNGEILTIPKSKDGYLRKLKLYGKSVQDGEPTPDNPVEIKTVPSELDITSCGINRWDSAKMFADLKAVHDLRIAYETFDGKNCAKVKSIQSNKQFRYGFKTNTQYRFKFSLYTLNEVGGINGAGFIIKYTDDTKTYMFRDGKFNIWNDLNVVSQAGKTIDYLNIGFGNSNTTYFDLDSFQITEGIEDIDYTPYNGSTTPITLRDTEGNLHTPKSLPDGTRDEVDLDGGESVEKVGIIVFDGTENWYVNNTGAKPEGLTRYFVVLGGYDIGLSANRVQLCSHFKPFSIVQGAYTADWYAPNTAVMYGFVGTASWYGVCVYEADYPTVNDFKAFLVTQHTTGNPVTVKYRRVTSIPWQLHPDERKKIITVDSDTAYVYTNAEVQPELSANAISYGEE